MTRPVESMPPTLVIGKEDLAATAIPWTDHLEELRYRLWWCIGAALAGAAAALVWAKPLLAWVVRPAGTVVFTAPQEALAVHVQLALAIGCVLAAPVIAYHAWQFAAVGLTDRERRLARQLVPWSAALFIIGAAFGYGIVVPQMMHLFLSFSSAALQPMISVRAYLEFVVWTVLGFGLAYELPLAMWGLTRLGVVPANRWAQARPVAIVAIFVVAAVVTPPDVVSQCLLAVPLVGLYEISTWLSRWGAMR